VTASVLLAAAAAFSLQTNALPRGSKLVHDSCVTPDGKYAFLAHSIGRNWLPVTQLDRGWVHDGALSVFDGKTGRYMTTVLLDDPERGAAEPWGVAADDKTIAVTHFGSSEISLIDRAGFEARLVERMNEDLSVDLTFMKDIRTRVKTLKQGPRGVALEKGKAVVQSYLQDDPGVTEGQLLWHDARLCFQQWQSCGSCHPGGGSDGMEWNFPAAGVGNPEKTRDVRASKKSPADLATCIANGFADDLLSAPHPEEAKKMAAWIESFRKPFTPPMWMVRDAKRFDAARRRLEAGETFDYVNVGSSTGKYGFDWDACGVKGINLASAPQALASDFKLLKRFRAAFNPGATIVFPLCPFTSVLPHYKDPNQFCKYYGLLPDGEIEYWTPQRGMGYARWIEQIGGYGKLPDDPELLRDAPPPAAQMQSSAEGFMRGWKREFAFDDFNAPLTAENRKSLAVVVALLKDVIAWCKAEGLKPVLVVPPCSKYYDAMWTDAFTKAYVLDFVKAADPKGEVPFYNLLKEPIFRDDAFYANSLMLNAKGRKVFTAELLSRLLKDAAALSFPFSDR